MPSQGFDPDREAIVLPIRLPSFHKSHHETQVMQVKFILARSLRASGTYKSH